MKAENIMTQAVIAMNPDMTVFAAIDLLVANKISGAPVLNEKDDLIGIVTEKDLLVALDFLGEKRAACTPLKEFMTEDTITVLEDTPIPEISRLLVNRNIKRVPVVKGSKVVGIVARRDILKFILKK